MNNEQKKKIVNIRNNRKNMWLIPLLVTVIIGAIGYYLLLPPLNLKSVSFWKFIFFLSVVFAIGYYFRAGQGQFTKVTGPGGKIILKNVSFRMGGNGGASRIPAIICGCLLVLPLLISFIFSSKLFHARAYSNILTTTEGTVETIPSAEGTSSIALMDTASAEKLGNREIGSLSEVVSQYNVSMYTQIDFGGAPVKTSPLRYDGLIKWFRNRKMGVPGYVIVNPVHMNADYVPLEKGMIYVPSAYFHENLERRIRFKYPTTMFGNLHFEIDEDGKPWYVASVYDHLIGLFGGEQVTGAIIVDPVSGDMQKLKTGDIPRWVDVVFPGDLICRQFNNYAQLKKGYWNSIFGQSECRKVTEFPSEDDDDSFVSDYGYIAKDGDIWIYTGVTSVNNDSSNIGFILSNERTEETIFIPCSGADEFSAMAAAEGEVQEKRYAASFPSLILVNDQPAYIMVLKDAGGLVKMYACVNVEQYNMVATASGQKECIDKYEALLQGNISPEQATDDNVTVSGTPAPDRESMTQKEITIARMQPIDRDGNTYLYLVDEEQNIYSARYIDVIDMLLAQPGDTITILTDGEQFLLP